MPCCPVLKHLARITLSVHICAQWCTFTWNSHLYRYTEILLETHFTDREALHYMVPNIGHSIAADHGMQTPTNVELFGVAVDGRIKAIRPVWLQPLLLRLYLFMAKHQSNPITPDIIPSRRFLSAHCPAKRFPEFTSCDSIGLFLLMFTN